MQTECAFGAQRGSFAGAPTGFRKLTPGLLQADRAAECFDGLPDEVEVHGQLLAAFKAAAPRLGLPVRLVHALDWLFRFTRPQDWEPGGRPIVWPSAATQQEALGLSESRVKSINRGLIDAGLVTMKDSPSGKRWGVRDGDGQIVEAYGFDLSPIATRHAEFVQLAAEAKAERELIGRLRRRATIARKAIAQILETVAEYGFGDGEWSRLRLDAAALVRSLRRFERPEEIAIGVASLERRQTDAKERLEKLLDAVDSGPSGPENRPHTIPTNQGFYSEEAVVAPEGCGSASDQVPPGETPERGEAARSREERDRVAAAAAPGTGHPLPPISRASGPRRDSGTVMRMSVRELLAFAPRLRTYLKTPTPAWPEIVDAADWLRGEMGVSQHLWGEACQALGREAAAIAIALVSAKPAEHFRTSPGGYFHGMVAKARAGELNLARTIWGLRQQAGPKAAPAGNRRSP